MTNVGYTNYIFVSKKKQTNIINVEICLRYLDVAAVEIKF